MNSPIFEKKSPLKSVDGIWVRSNTVPRQTSAVVMEKNTSLFKNDIVLAAISVIPASIVWVFTEHFYAAIALGAGIFLAAEYGYPALKNGTINTEPAFRFFSQLREMIRSRVARGA